MKNLALTIGALFITSTLAFGQGNLKGPKAKNAKPWETEKQTTTVVKHDINKNDFKGPQAKNFKAQDHDREVIMVAAVQSNPHGKTGPQAKNHKPWMNSTQFDNTHFAGGEEEFDHHEK